jgi:DNA adenine methylase
VTARVCRDSVRDAFFGKNQSVIPANQQAPGKGTPPFLKWAGGKRWLTTRASIRVPEGNEVYFEPFLGSAAMFFHLRPTKSVLSDANASLIETYQAIQSDYEKVAAQLKKHASRHNADYYYSVRSMECRNEYTRAAQFIYLNRTCWNGLYRVNQKGVFNVPIGTKLKVLLDDDDFSEVARMLNNSELSTADFEKQIDRAKDGDLIFADPPYTVRHKHNGFIKYNENLFSWEDQVRLRDALLRAKKKGARIALTNADHESIRSLYEQDFAITELSRYSAIAGASGSRGNYPELLIE